MAVLTSCFDVFMHTFPLVPLLSMLSVTLLAVVVGVVLFRIPRARGNMSVPVSDPVPVIVRTEGPPSRIAIDPNAGHSAPGTYPQLGYLKSTDGTEVLPLYGRPSIVRRGRWFFYTIPPSSSGIKVPLHTVTSKRDCMEDVGCEELYTGDLVTIPDATGATTWSVVVYKYNRL